jgi:hypothetical protein
MDKYTIATYTGEDRRQKGTMKIWDPKNPSLPHVDSAVISTFFSNASKCGLLSVREVTQESIVGTVAATGANLDRVVTVTARPDPTIGGKWLRFRVPAPKATGIMTAQGQRLTSAEGTTLVGAWKTANGITASYTFIRGVFTQRV